jgi:hypothetical protein
LKKQNLIILLASIFLIAGNGQSTAQSYYNNSLGLSGGIYSASGFGTNPYFALRFNHFFSNKRFFFEASYGIGSLESDVLNNVGGFQLFDSDKLHSYEFLVAYDAVSNGNVPFIIGGVSGINQGGQSVFSYVFGVGKHIPLSQFFNTDRLGIRYDARDQIFKQTLDNDNSYISHNLIFTLGLQLYF